MSWEASGFIKKQLACPDGAPMSRGQKLLLLVLADYHDTRRSLAWPSVVTLAEETLSSLAQTKRDLAYLEEHCSLVRQRRREGRGEGGTYQYKFVGLDVTIEDARALLESPGKESVKRGQDEPFFSAAEKGSQRVQKGFTGAQEKGSERVHGARHYKEEPEPSTKPKNHKHHAASGEMSFSQPVKDWISIKTKLTHLLPDAEWKLWVRPAFLLKVMAGDDLLVAIPANGAIAQAAHNRREILRELASSMGYRGGVHFTPYPDDHTMERMRNEYPEHYAQCYGREQREANLRAETA